MRYLLPIRLSVPLALLGFGLLVTLLSFGQAIAQANHHLEEEMTRRASFLGNLLAGMVEYQFRQGSQEGVDLLLSLAAASPDLNLAVLVDAKTQRILYPSSFVQRQHFLSETLSVPLRPLMAKTFETMSRQIQLSADRNTVLAVFPVNLAAPSAQLTPSRQGALVLEFDLSDLKRQALYDEWVRSILLSALLALLCFLLWLFFQQTLTKRVARLVEATQQLSHGVVTPALRLEGADELAQLAHAFDQMATRLQTKRAELVATNERLASEVEVRREAEEALGRLNEELEARVKDRTAELEAANLRLKELDRLKSELVNTVSHELRTPLTSITGYVEFLEEQLGGPLTPEQRAFVTQIQAGVTRLARLVDDLLDFARIEAGTFKLFIQEANLSQLVSETLSSLVPQAKDADLLLEAALPKAPVVLMMDAKRVGQVLLNLLGNAIKFTPAGGRITVAVLPEPEEVRVEVQDTGIGIAPEAQQQLFEKFYQVESTGARGRSGVGLGLSISKALVEAHGGRIGVVSAPGKGSCFWFTIPRSLRPTV
ncbi:HAMP domain-containing protein [bacterium]|nr:HAMP domain-containing protein [bacterium]